MTCEVPFCTAVAVGQWHWRPPDHPGEVRWISYPMCDEHRRQKAASRAPGEFRMYESST